MKRAPAKTVGNGCICFHKRKERKGEVGPKLNHISNRCVPGVRAGSVSRTVHWDNQFWKGISTDIIKHSPLMKILCVVTIEALIDGRGMGEVGGCAGYDGGSAAHANLHKFITFPDLN